MSPVKTACLTTSGVLGLAAAYSSFRGCTSRMDLPSIWILPHCAAIFTRRSPVSRLMPTVAHHLPHVPFLLLAHRSWACFAAMIRAVVLTMKVCASCKSRAFVWSSAPKSKVGAAGLLKELPEPADGAAFFPVALPGASEPLTASAVSVVGIDPSGAAGDAAVWLFAAVAASEHCADGVGCSSAGSMGAFLQGLASLRAVSICSGSS